MQSTIEASAAGRTSWEELPGPGVLEKTAEALKANGFRAQIAPDRRAALEAVGSLIPDGSSVMTGGSATLDAIGLTKMLSKENHPWVNLKGKVVAEQDPVRKTGLRREATFAEFFIGSVHAVTEQGQLVAGSATGSQLAAYAYGGNSLILVVGAQKITANIDEALKRLREHSTPLEDQRMKGLGRPGTVLSKILIYEKETWRKVYVILVNEKLGF